MFKKVFPVLTAFLLVPGMALAAEGDAAGGVFSTTELSTIIQTITSVVNVQSIVQMTAAMITACIGIVFMWWAIRKGIKVIMSAVRKGRVSA